MAARVLEASQGEGVGGGNCGLYVCACPDFLSEVVRRSAREFRVRLAT